MRSAVSVRRCSKLTELEQASLPEFAERWVDVASSTEPIDPDEATAAVRDLYLSMGLPPPVTFVAGSPIGGAILREAVAGALHAVAGGPRVDQQRLRQSTLLAADRAVIARPLQSDLSALDFPITDDVLAGLATLAARGRPDTSPLTARGRAPHVSDALSSELLGEIRRAVAEPVRLVERALNVRLRSELRTSVAARLGPPRWADKRSAHFDLADLAFYDYLSHHGLTDRPDPAGVRLAHSVGRAWLHRGFAVICDRPATLHLEPTDARGGELGLHNDDGPALAYRDGWRLFAWHGLAVPDWVITAPSVRSIQREPNTEIRRAAIERLGWERYLHELNVAPIHECPDPGNGGHNLRLFDLPSHAQVFGRPVRLAVMDNASLDRDGTRRTYAETVPADIPDAVAAQAWAFDVDPHVYAALGRAT